MNSSHRLRLARSFAPCLGLIALFCLCLVGLPVTVHASSGPFENLAPLGTATQSSTVHGGVASRAIDGNTNGHFFAYSVTHTNGSQGSSAGAWWQVDLGEIRYIDRIVVWNRTDCCSARLSDFVLTASLTEETPNTPPRGWVFRTEGPAERQTTFRVERPARYVLIQLPDDIDSLSLAEVEVWGRPTTFRNLAREGTATQTSTIAGGVAWRAIDGNTDGNFFNGSVTHTATESGNDVWWEVDLGTYQHISRVDVWNRTDCCGDQLADVRVGIGQPPAIAVLQHDGIPGSRVSFQVGIQGRFVRIILPAGVALSLAEVQVWGGENLETGPLSDLRPAPAEPFSVIIASDSQFWWDIDGQDVSRAEAEESNRRHVSAMNQLAAGNGLPAGFTPPQSMIMNGDVTAFARWDEWDAYDAIYGELSIFTYLGLGNHDYGGNVVGDCAADALDRAFYFTQCASGSDSGVWGEGPCTVLDHMTQEGHDWCASDSVRRTRWWIRQNLGRLTSYDPDSLAYSWDIDNVRFIQLHNFPTWEAPSIGIDSSITWLEEELQRARSGRKWVVINMHDYGHHMSFYNQEFINAITGFEFNILGIFGGHIHGEAGFRGSITVNGYSIPWFRSGSAEYNMFNLVQFDETGMRVTVIDSNDGQPVHYSGSRNLDGGQAAAPYARAYPYNPCPGVLQPAPFVGGCVVHDEHRVDKGRFRPERSEVDDHLGHAIAGGDFNGDGIDDLAVGVPREDRDGDNTGLVQVAYGSPGLGLGTTDSQTWTQNSPGIGDFSEADDRFGGALTAGDFNGDGFDDLAIASPTEDVPTGGNNNEGQVHILYGSSGGLTYLGHSIWNQDSPAVLGVAQVNDQFGHALAAGDFNRDGYDDLAIGVPREDIDTGDNDDDGAVNVLYGSLSGITAAGNQMWQQDNYGIVGSAERGDWFGWSLAAGHFDDDGFEDLAIGIPREDVLDGHNNNDGMVAVLYGYYNGLHWFRNAAWHQSNLGVGDGAEQDDHFGWALAAGDFDRDGDDDLAVGSPEEDIDGHQDAGGLTLMFSGGANGFGAQNLFWHQNTAGIPGGNEGGDNLGKSLATGDFNRDGRDDIAIGLPAEGVGSHGKAGRVLVLYPGIWIAQEWHQDTQGVSGHVEGDDHFGYALATGDFDGDRSIDLAVGAPKEDLGSGGNQNDGTVTILYGEPAGLSSVREQEWRQQ